MSEIHWDRRLFRGNKVWVRVDGEGGLALDENGLAVMRYKPDDPREYNARPAEVAPITEEALSQAARARATKRRRSTHLDVFAAAGADPDLARAGAGIVLEGDGYRREIAISLAESTHNVSELTAVAQALSRIKDTRRPIRLHVDSGYLAGVLSGKWPAGANRELIDRVRVLMGRFETLKLVREKGRAPGSGLERAAALAGEAVRTGESSETLVAPEGATGDPDQNLTSD